MSDVAITEGAEPIAEAELAAPDERVCEACGTVVDAEDVFCGGCGRQIPESGAASILGQVDGVRGFRCDTCGAVMTFSATHQKLSCAFCGSSRLTESEKQLQVLPSRAIRFVIAAEEVTERFRGWLGASFWRPADLAETAAVEEFRGIYVPHWLFTCDVHTYWTADHNAVPQDSRGEWAPTFGESGTRYTGLLVPASGALSQVEAEGLAPYDFTAAVPYEPTVLDESPMEDFAVPRKTARAVASSRLIAHEHARCASLVPGTRHRNLHINPLIQNMVSFPVLLPVWILTYRYHEHLYRFLLNGQTGEIKGTGPLSWGRIALVVGGVVAVLLILFFFFTGGG